MPSPLDWLRLPIAFLCYGSIGYAASLAGRLPSDHVTVTIDGGFAVSAVDLVLEARMLAIYPAEGRIVIRLDDGRSAVVEHAPALAALFATHHHLQFEYADDRAVSASSMP